MSAVSSGLRAVFLADRPMLLRLLTARLGAEEAEDALQDLWLKVEGGASGPIAEPSAYLYRMANNVALDRRRAAQRRIARDAGWAEMQPAAHEQPGAERELLARSRLVEVEAALAALPERAAEAFRLYRFEELGQKAVAEEMGISVSGVEKLLQRAYRTIHDVVRGEGVDISQRRRLGVEEERDVDG